MRCDSLWTADVNEALDFRSVQRASFFGLKELKDAFRVMQMELNGLLSPAPLTIPQPQWQSVQVPPAEPDEFSEPLRRPQSLRHRPPAGCLGNLPNRPRQNFFPAPVEMTQPASPMTQPL